MTLRRSTGFLNKLGGIKTNKITNGAFGTDASGWTATNASLAATGGQLQITETGGTNPGKAYQDVTTVVGRIYKFTFTFQKGTGASGSVLVGTTSDASSILTSPNYTDTSATTKELAFIATATTTRITLQSNSTTAGETALFDNVVVEEVFDGFGDIFKYCKIAVFTGSQPSSADSASSGTLLYTLTNNDDGSTGLTWGESSSGVVSKNAGESWKGTAVAGGVAGWFRCYEQGDDPTQASSTFARFDGAIATSGAEVNMSNTTIESGAVQTCTSFTYTQPA